MGIIWVFVSTEVGGMLDEVLDQSEIDDDKCTAEGRWLRMPVFGTFCALVSGVETMLQGGFLLHLSHDPSVRGEVSSCFRIHFCGAKSFFHCTKIPRLFRALLCCARDGQQ